MTEIFPMRYIQCMGVRDGKRKNRKKKAKQSIN